MYIKIGQIELLSDVEIIEVKKRDYVILVIGKKNDLASLQRFFKLKNHYLKCIIKHEKLEYTGFMQICGVSSDFVSVLSIKLSFEP